MKDWAESTGVRCTILGYKQQEQRSIWLQCCPVALYTHSCLGDATGALKLGLQWVHWGYLMGTVQHQERIPWTETREGLQKHVSPSRGYFTSLRRTTKWTFRHKSLYFLIQVTSALNKLMASQRNSWVLIHQQDLIVCACAYMFEICADVVLFGIPYTFWPLN